MSSHWVIFLGFAHILTNALLDYTGCSLSNLVNNTDNEWKDSLARQKKWCVIFPVLRVTPLTLLYPTCFTVKEIHCSGPGEKKQKSWQMWKAVRWNEPYFNVRWGTECLFSNRVCRLSRHLCKLFKSLLVLLNSIMSVCWACRFVEI